MTAARAPRRGPPRNKGWFVRLRHVTGFEEIPKKREEKKKKKSPSRTTRRAARHPPNRAPGLLLRRRRPRRRELFEGIRRPNRSRLSRLRRAHPGRARGPRCGRGWRAWTIWSRRPSCAPSGGRSASSPSATSSRVSAPLFPTYVFRTQLLCFSRSLFSFHPIGAALMRD